MEAHLRSNTCSGNLGLGSCCSCIRLKQVGAHICITANTDDCAATGYRGISSSSRVTTLEPRIGSRQKITKKINEDTSVANSPKTRLYQSNLLDV